MPHTHNVWNVENTRRLFALAEEASAENRPLAEVYRRLAQETGLSEGSVRNYYYAHLNTFRLIPELSRSMGIRVNRAARTFTPFEDGEAEELVKRVLTRKAKGESVRAVVDALADHDQKLALRLQNKYRSIVFRQRARTERLLAELSEAHETYFHPYLNKICVDGRLPEGETSDDRADALLAAMNSMMGILERGGSDKLADLRTYLDGLNGGSHAGQG